jgi:hypothetical protein
MSKLKERLAESQNNKLSDVLENALKTNPSIRLQEGFSTDESIELSFIYEEKGYTLKVVRNENFDDK